MGEVYASLPQVDRAYETYQQARGLAVELGLRPLEGLCLLRIGKLSRELGMEGEGHEHISRAYRMFSEMGMRTWLDQLEVAP